MYKLLLRYLPPVVCEWLVAAFYALLLTIIFAYWGGESTGFHYLEI